MDSSKLSAVCMSSYNPLIQEFLKECQQQLGLGTELQRTVFEYRYNPSNQEISLREIADLMIERLKLYIANDKNSRSINPIAARVNQRILEAFEQELRGYYINNNSITYREIYQWLWEVKFPEMA